MNTCQSSYRRGWRWLALIALVVIGSGCARSCRSVPSIHLPAEASAPSLDSPDVATVDPVYHLVRPGQTLWWISRKYGVTVEEAGQHERSGRRRQIVSGPNNPDPRSSCGRVVLAGTG